MVGSLRKINVLFLGDFVDRGVFSIEVIILILALKINYPTKVFILRGNHECRQMTTQFNFRQECLRKYNQGIYEKFIDLFDHFPIGAVINKKFIALHGGISPQAIKIEQLNEIDRFQEPPLKGILCDILWSDPTDNYKGKQGEEYEINDKRGCSFYYGYRAISNFLQANNLMTLIRAHEVQLEGFKIHDWDDLEIPPIITVFSAPNYCDSYGNKGAILTIRNNQVNLKQFYHVQHPCVLPDYMNVFDWSLPFIGEKICTMFYHLLSQNVDEKEGEEELPKIKSLEHLEQRKKSRLIMQKKILFIAKMIRIQRDLKNRQSNLLNISEKNMAMLKKFNSNSCIESEQFERIKIQDSANERRHST